MRYMFLLYVDESLPEREGSEENISEHIALAREAVAKGAYVACNALEVTSKATTVRVRDGRTVVSDGPFAETKEALGGYYIMECRDLDEAIAYASRIPPARVGSVEIRPLFEIPDWDEAIGLRQQPAASQEGETPKVVRT
ncbi:MAG: YciI family protein [Dehalococcoidia bacterium]